MQNMLNGTNILEKRFMKKVFILSVKNEFSYFYHGLKQPLLYNNSLLLNIFNY